MTSQRITDALIMAIWRRGRPQELLHHSDQGSQYTSEPFQRLMADHGIPCSRSRSGNVWDNAAMESFFSSLKTDRTRKQAHADVFDYIERFYNPTRPHSTIGYLSPMTFDERAMKPQVAGHQTRSRPISRLEGSLSGLPIESQLLPECRRPKDRTRRTRRCSPGCPRHRKDPPVRHLDEAAEEGREALRPPQTHSGYGSSSTTRSVRRKRRIPPRCHRRPEPPQTGQDPSCIAANAQSLIRKGARTQFRAPYFTPATRCFSTGIGTLRIFGPI